jgi:hypothetical protein
VHKGLVGEAQVVKHLLSSILSTTERRRGGREGGGGEKRKVRSFSIPLALNLEGLVTT